MSLENLIKVRLPARRVAVHAGDLQLHPGHARFGEAADSAGEPAAAGEPLQGAEAADQGRGQGTMEDRWRGSGDGTCHSGYRIYLTTPWDQGKIVTISDIRHEAITYLEVVIRNAGARKWSGDAATPRGRGPR